MSGRARGDAGLAAPVHPESSGGLRVPRRRRVPGIPVAVVAGTLLAALVAVAACRGGGEGSGGAPEGGPAAGEERRGVSPVEDGGGSGDAGGRVSRGDTAREDDRPLRRYRLRLVNRSAGSLRYFAAAGRGEVVLDTVAPADSGDVWVETRAVRLVLRAAAGGERTVRRDTVELREGELTRWSAGGG